MQVTQYTESELKAFKDRPETAPKIPVIVTVSDIRMPFMSMVVFMIKLSLAAIPAVIVGATAWFFVYGILTGMKNAG